MAIRTRSVAGEVAKAKAEQPENFAGQEWQGKKSHKGRRAEGRGLTAAECAAPEVYDVSSAGRPRPRSSRSARPA